MRNGDKFWCLLLAALLSSAAAAQAWRSSLYPDNWTPADKDAQDRFLHDFSYAGYHKGEVSIPTNPPGLTYDVTSAPYNADNSGSIDATAAIQSAIDDAGAAGGGIVYLPAGTYNVAPGANTYSLLVNSSGVVLRGAGTNQTYICNTETYMRGKKVVKFQPSSGDWHSPLGGSEILATSDIGYPTRTIPLASVSGLSTGDTIIVRADCTTNFIADHGMTGQWDASLQGPTICRRITSINVSSNTVNIDIPTRYYMKTRDNARIYKVAPLIEEVGIEDLSIGMIQNPTAGWGDEDYTVPGTGAYEVHGSYVIGLKHCRNAWVQRVATYRPSANSSDYHVLSNVLLIDESIHVTARHCLVQKPQYEGGGGNGYGYIFGGNDCLVTECVAISCRHNYDLKSMRTTGNVFHKCEGRASRLSSDFHMHLSMGNMFDSMTINGDWLQAVYRPWGTILHGHATTESVFWNTYGEDSGTAVESAQWGWGYVIGTSGGRSGVTRGTANNTAPEDFLEGQGTGDTLEPQSLYDDQLAKRMLGVLASAGEDQNLFVTNAAVPLSGSVYSYINETPTSVWSQVSGPTAAFSDTNALSITVACTNVGTYVFQLTAWDGAKTNTDEMTVVVLDSDVATLVSKDYIIGESDGPTLTYYPDGNANQVGAGGATGSKSDRNVVMGYSLPTLDAGTTVTGATFSFEITAARDTVGNDPSLHVYLLNTSDPDSTGTNFFYHGLSNTTAEAKFVGETYIAVDSTELFFNDDEYDIQFTLSGEALALLQGFYGGDNAPDQPEVFFRFNLDQDPTINPSTQYNRYRLDMASDESILEVLGTDPPPPGAIAWTGEMTVGISSNSAWVFANANTNLSDAVLVWDTSDHGAGSTNDWPEVNRNPLGAQPTGVVTSMIAGLSADAAYAWRVYGETTNTNGWSAPEWFVTALTEAQKPVFTNAVALSSTSIQLGWQDNAVHETGYILQRSTNAGSGYITIDTLASNTTAYVDSGLSHTTTYYQLGATNSGNGSATDVTLCMTNATTQSVVGGALVSRDSIVGRRQEQAPALGYYPDANSGQAGVGGSITTTTRVDRLPVFGFELPVLPAGTTVSNATLSFEITGARDDSSRDPSLNVYILNTANPDSSGTNYFYHGPSNSTAEAEFVGETFIDVVDGVSVNFTDDEHDQHYVITGDALVLLQSFYGGDNIPEQSEVFFRFNLDVVPLDLTGGGAYDRYFVDTALDESSLQITATTPAGDDTDSDGMSDAWEIANFGALTNSAGTVSDDHDGDGFIDLHEYLAGTSPTNGSSLLLLDSVTAPSGTNVILSWQAVTGRTYQVLMTTNLAGAVWQTNMSGIDGVSPFTTVTNSVPTAGGFFRIRLE